MAANQEPRSPGDDFSREIEAYTPSNESDATLSEFSRYDLRRMNGQHPDEMPHKFMPKVTIPRLVWPTNEEAYAWAEEAIEGARMRPLS